jgi:hypothetical protein
MSFRKLAGACALAACVLAGGSALAQSPVNAEYYPFAEIMSMKMIDKNKDGMVSRKEYLDMMAMAWDMNARKMGATEGKMTPEQLREVLMYLKAGG